jgi:CSLREA domain-containing protein
LSEGIEQLARWTRVRTVRWIAASAIVAGLIVPVAASAASIAVTTTSDDFNAGTMSCSLREAVWAANNDSSLLAPGCTAGSGNDTIDVPQGVYELSRPGPGEDAGLTGDLDVTGPTTIKHTGPGRTVVDARGLDRVFNTATLGGVTISGLEVRGGISPTSGGGIFNSGNLTVTDSTIVGNASAAHGGGIETAGAAAVLTVVNSTVSGNKAVGDGGGVDESRGQAHLVSSTVTANLADSDSFQGGNGGGIGAFITGAVFSIQSSLIAGNSDNGGEAPDCVAQSDATLVSLGQSLLGDSAGCTLTGGLGDITGVKPKLRPLADNGGPTPTHALRQGSPALGTGGSCPLTDQRGVPRSLGGLCDIGSYELVRCKGEAADHVGTNGPDVLSGTKGGDVFVLLGGVDRARGLGGDDVFCGGAGHDTELGGPGDDSEYGDTGRDDLRGGPGDDLLSGGGGRDRLRGGGGEDRLRGGRGKDRCDGGGGREDRDGGCESPRNVP